MTDSGRSPQWQDMTPARAARPSPQEMPAPAPVGFEAAFRGEFDYVWFTLRRLGVHPRDLEDVTHDVFVLVHRHFDRYDPSRPIRPWLFGFAYRAAADYRRLARHRIEIRDDLADMADPAASAVDRAAARQSLELAWTALERLDLDRRAVFVLHEVEGYAMPEIASALQIPLNTAYSRLRVARDQFARAVQHLQRGAS
jgi:RNA polymerase sigma-70 factor (ECF subfamily)